MQADLDKQHAEILLKTHHIGRLGCVSAGRPYVVPITYVYDDGVIYGHTNEGKKLEMMRQNPSVCLEVDDIADFSRWQSVVCWGTFEELDGTESAKALDLLLTRLTPPETEAIGDDGVMPLDYVSQKIKLRALKGATYRIRVDEISGRYERP